ncbi:hypothetical protein OPT61_g5907 [Boeremia exigua]|uniref:Uncharacterized protein n=1 Tax=Boeremia exigua TaxID=749465 RepID=A0ACC2I8J1_9PLEO|nr:hypothetical protein OPT61_g5907 [Boeremia exigua]
MSSANSTKPQLQRANTRTDGRPDLTDCVRPVEALQDPIKRFLPPPGDYYDQHTFIALEDTFDYDTRCVLCCNPKIAGKKCECRLKCTLCDTKVHRGRECSKLYADLEWWRAHGHQLRKKAQVRPSPGERAYLVITGVLKEWTTSSDIVVVNMEHPNVEAFYKDKDAPKALDEIPWNLQPASAAIASRSDVLNPQLGTDGEVNLSSYRHTSDHDTTFYARRNSILNETKPLETHSGKIAEISKISYRTQTGSTAAEDRDIPLHLEHNSWQPPSYHEGRQYATMTPLSLRLAVFTAQYFECSVQPTPSGDEVRRHPDPELKLRVRPQQSAYASQTAEVTSVAPGIMKDTETIGEVGVDDKAYRKELEEAHEVIRAQIRRIQELELALHESEGWTDAVTYRGGKKRLRE